MIPKMPGWDYRETYVAACGKCFSTYAQGIDHERHCAECFRELRRWTEPYEEDDDERVDINSCADQAEQRRNSPNRPLGQPQKENDE